MGRTNSDLLFEFKNRLEGLSNFSSNNIEKEFKFYLEEKQLEIGNYCPKTLRVSLTGLGMRPFFI